MGIQKCRKTIENSIGNPHVFKVFGAPVVFKLLRRILDLRTAKSYYATSVTKNQKNDRNDPLANLSKLKLPGSSMSFTGLTGIVDRKRKDKIKAREDIFRRWGKPIAMK